MTTSGQRDQPERPAPKSKRARSTASRASTKLTSTSGVNRTASELALIRQQLRELDGLVRSVPSPGPSRPEPASAPQLLVDIEQALAALRQAHQAQLVRLDQVAARAQTVEVVRSGVRTALKEARVRRVDAVDDPSWFDVVPAADGALPGEVLAPAYVDATSGRLVQPGRVTSSAQRAGTATETVTRDDGASSLR